jgi:hypothetical protein
MRRLARASQRTVNEHCLQRLVELSFIVYGFSLWLSFVCGLPTPIRPAAQSRGMKVRLETYSTHSTHPADDRLIVLRAAGCGSVPEAGYRSSE